MASDPRESLRIVEGASGIQNSPVGLLIHAVSKLITSSEKRDGALAAEAAQDFKYVQFLFHDNQASLGFRLVAIASAIRLAQREGRTDDAQRYIREGRPLAETLAAATDYPAGQWSCQQFYLASDDQGAAWRAIRNVGRHPGTYCWFLAAECLARYGSSAAAEFDKLIAPEHKDSKYVRLAKAHLVRDLPDGAEEVKKLVGKLPEDDPSPLIRRHALLALCLACNSDEVRARAASATMPGLWYNAACLDYLAGVIDEAKLLANAEQSEVFKANARFTLAMMRLADGDRTGAIRHLRECSATGTVGYFDYEWARAYLERLDAEPDWPGWIGEKSGKQGGG